MDRRSTSYTLRTAATTLLLSLAALTVGCNTIPVIARIISDGKAPGPYAHIVKEMKDKKVAIVCRCVASEEFANQRVPKVLSRALQRRMGNNLRSIKFIRQEKIDDWVDRNQFNDFPEIGEAVGADYVLGINLEHFTVHGARSQTLLQGLAGAQFQLIEVESGRTLVDESMEEMRYPVNSPMPASEVSEADFTNDFVDKFAHRIGCYFYPSDHMDGYASDADDI